MGSSATCARANLVRPEAAVSADRESMRAGDEYERLYGDALGIAKASEPAGSRCPRAPEYF